MKYEVGPLADANGFFNRERNYMIKKRLIDQGFGELVVQTNA